MVILSEHGLSKSDLHSLQIAVDDAKNLPKTKALRKGYVVQKYYDGEHKRFGPGEAFPNVGKELCDPKNDPSKIQNNGGLHH